MKDWAAKMQGLVKGRGATAAIVQTLITRFLIIGVNVATGTITARVLGPSGRGEQAAIGIWPQFFAYSVSLGLPSALLYSLKRYPEMRSQSFSAAIVICAGLSALGIGIGVFTLPFLMTNYSPTILHLAQWMLFAVPLVAFLELLRAAMEASDEFAIANQIRYFPPLSTLLMLVTLALTHQLTSFTGALSYWLPTAPVLVWMMLRARRFFQIQFHQFQSAAKHLLGYGLRAYGIDLITTITGQLQQVLAVSLLAPSAMGLYAITFSLCQLLYIVQGSFVTVLFPKAAARPTQEVIEMTGRAVRISGLLALAFALTMMVLAPIILKILYGSEYLDAIPLFRILAIEMVLSGTAIVLSQAFMALDRPGVITVMQSVSFVAVISFILVMTPRYGLIGLGIALLSATIIRLMSVLVCFPIVLKTAPPSLIVVRKDFEFLKQKILDRF
jgi:O-antigen/teichoic acid export membrane protein